MRVVYWILTIVVAVAAAVFAVFNRGPVVVDLWPFPALQLPLYPLVLGALLLGFLLGRLVGWLSHLPVKRERARLAKQADRLQADFDRSKTPAPSGRSLAA